MKRIRADDLIDLFERMHREHWAYAWGASSEGRVDCSGAFVYAYRKLGGPEIEHGSNSILHLRMGELLPMHLAKPSYAAVKVRPWNESERGNRWYGKEPGDAYHIGLMGRDGKVLNAQGTQTGFVASKASGWAGCAPLLAVDYDEEEEVDTMYGNATVKTKSGRLNIREGASETAKILSRAEKGSRLNVLREAGNGWLFVRTESGEEGYVSAEFVEMDAEIPGGEDAAQGDGTKVTIIDSEDNSFQPVGDFRVLIGSID